MATPSRLNRQKISTTIAPETLAYLERLISARKAATLAEAIDVAVQRLRAAENRQRLERDTAIYFDQMSDEELAEERRLGSALATSSRGLDFDREP